MTKAELQRLRRARYRIYIVAYKLEKGCIDCGYKEHAAALDFDHVRGEKSFDVSQAHKYGIKTLRREMDKCEIRCANCHRIKTQERRLEKLNGITRDQALKPCDAGNVQQVL